MAKLFGNARQSTSKQNVSEGADVFLRLLRDGSISAESFKQVCVMAGLGFHVTAAAFSTGTIGGTIFDIDEPQFVLSIPKNTTIMPTRIAVQVQGGAPADGEEVEILVAVDQDAAAVATGVALTVAFTEATIYNMNTLYGNSSACLALDDSTDSLTDPVMDIELARR